MFKSEVGGEIAYYLAKHPSTHDRIMKLPAERLYAELGKLEDKLSEKQEEQKVNKTTQAPAKLTETKGGSAPTGADPAKAARKGYAEWLAADKSRSEKEKGNIKTPQQFRRDRIR